MSERGKTSPPPLRPLPVDDCIAALLTEAAQRNVVVVAPPGSGKTSRIPSALAGRVAVVEPRRIAARMAATWVAGERGQAVGDEVGYQVRFDARCGPRTRVRYVTDGVLARRLLDDPSLSDLDVVVVDEFHERRLHTDVLLAWLRRLQQTTRPDLRLVVMSATIDPAPLAAWLGDAAIIETSGRLHDVRIAYDEPGSRPLDACVAAAVRRALDEGDGGDVLVFLPGAAEIRRAMDACASIVSGRDVDALPLHGDLPLERQAAAVGSGPRRRVVFSTNVAESSVTVEGVTTVIDSGLVRRARTVPWSGLDEIRVEKISRASAEQRAGRAGRVAPGQCVRLYPRHDLVNRPAREAAEIHGVDLSEVLLLLHGAGVADPSVLPWFEPPSEGAAANAEALLRRLQALDDGGLTRLGRRMLDVPLHPRLARLALEAERLGAGDDGRLAAAVLAEGDVRAGGRARFDRGERAREHRTAPSDVIAMVEACRTGHDADPRALQRTQALERHLRRALPGSGPRVRGGSAPDAVGREEALLRAVLAAWPDRVARRRGKAGSTEVLMCGGGTARLAETSVVRDADWLVAVDAEERAGGTFVRVASEIDAAWLLDLFIDRIRETDERAWNERSQRVECVRRLAYDRLTLDESRVAAPRDQVSSAVLAGAARQAGLGVFTDPAGLEGFLHRVAFLARALPGAGISPLTGTEGLDVLDDLCNGCLSFDEVRAAADRGGFIAALQARLSPNARRLLERAAPSHVTVRGRRVAVHYEADRAPWIASRLQDFFGMREGPTVAEGRVPLVLHLLAPNQRPVQVTTDLAGFWTRHYPGIRRELCRRYPKHAWPENPLGGGG